MTPEEIKAQYGIDLSSEEAAAIRSITLDPAQKDKHGTIGLQQGYGAYKPGIENAVAAAGYTQAWVAGDLKNL